MDCSAIGIAVIRTARGGGAKDTALEFFRHYGHPQREERQDRLREVLSIAVLYAFVLYFPAGLALLSLMNDPAQYLWLSHQIYCVVVMRIVRLCGWQGYAATEQRIAALLVKGLPVDLRSGESYMCARLSYSRVRSVAKGAEKVREIVKGNLD